MRIFLQALALAALIATSAHGAEPAKPPDKMAATFAAYEAGDLKAAAAGFAALSAQHNPLGDFNLAMMHIRAEVPKPNGRLAKRLLERAAAKNLVLAELALGQFYEQGMLGKRDLVQANVWYALAAEHGNTDGQVAIGTAYYLGRGAAKDMAQAARWFREAANGGDVGAQYLLASMYETGLGLTADLRLARYWYDIAARNGDEAAPTKVKELDARLAEGPPA
jgi:TPR repeat protein